MITTVSKEETSVEVDLTIPDSFSLTCEENAEHVMLQDDDLKHDDTEVIVLDTEGEADEADDTMDSLVEKELSPTIDKEELDKRIKISKETKYLHELTLAELDAFFPVTDKVSLDTTKKEEETKRMMGLFKEASHFDEEKKNQKKSTNSILRDWRYLNYKYYETEIKNGFIRSCWFTTCRCQLCDEILSCFPSSYKRIYYLHSSRCPFCCNLYNRIDRSKAEEVRYAATKWRSANTLARHEMFWIKK